LRQLQNERMMAESDTAGAAATAGGGGGGPGEAGTATGNKRRVSFKVTPKKTAAERIGMPAAAAARR